MIERLSVLFGRIMPFFGRLIWKVLSAALKTAKNREVCTSQLVFLSKNQKIIDKINPPTAPVTTTIHGASFQ